jgi:hypothetical protein
MGVYRLAADGKVTMLLDEIWPEWTFAFSLMKNYVGTLKSR